jgi:hypothetical protein
MSKKKSKFTEKRENIRIPKRLKIKENEKNRHNLFYINFLLKLSTPSVSKILFKTSKSKRKK